MPPIFSIFVTALVENLLALTVNFLVSSPLPNTLTPLSCFLIIFLSFNTSGVTTSPSLKNLSKSLKLIIANLVSNCLLLKPLIGILLYNGEDV